MSLTRVKSKGGGGTQQPSAWIFATLFNSKKKKFKLEILKTTMGICYLAISLA